MNKILKIENLSFKFNKKENYLFKNLSFSFNKGLNFLCGKNGSGKSTLLRIINNCIHQDEVVEGKVHLGEVFYDIKNSGLNSEIVSISQNYNEMLADQFTAKDNLKFAKFPKYPRLKFISEDLYNQKIDIPMGKKVKYLSGGQKQILSILMALEKDVKILILDEPTAALDDKNSIIVMNFLKSLAESKEIIIICVCHDKELVKQYANECLVIEEHESQKTVKIVVM